MNRGGWVCGDEGLGALVGPCCGNMGEDGGEGEHADVSGEREDEGVPGVSFPSPLRGFGQYFKVHLLWPIVPPCRVGDGLVVARAVGCRLWGQGNEGAFRRGLLAWGLGYMGGWWGGCHTRAVTLQPGGGSTSSSGPGPCGQLLHWHG